MKTELNILLLCNKPNVGADANTIVDHIESIEKYSKNNVYLYSNLGDFSKKLDLNRFDVIIIHYSLCLLNNYYISKESKNNLRNFSGLKVVFIQDEYRQIDKMIQELNYLKIDILFTCFPKQEINKIYPENKLPGVSKYPNLTGYIHERLTKISNQTLIKNRQIHVGYRGRKLPFWYGELGYEKWNIVEKWLDHTSNSKLISDISYNENDRIYGEKWIEFLSSCKTTLGVESGASVMDFTGELEKQIDLYQMTHPNDSFHKVQQKYLLPYENKHKLNQISPRCFEAIALKTVLVLYEGEYSGILIPNRHYIVLKKDFSNIQEVIKSIKNDDFLQAMADLTYQEIALNPKYSYKFFIENIDKIIGDEFKIRSKDKVISPYKLQDFQRDIRYKSLKSKFYGTGQKIYIKLPIKFRLIVKGVLRPKLTIKYCIKSFYRFTTNMQKKNNRDLDE